MSGIKHGVCTGHGEEACMVFVDPFGWGKDYCPLCLFMESQLIEPAFEDADTATNKDKEILEAIFKRIHRLIEDGVFNYAGNFYERTKAMVEDARQSYAIGLAMRVLDLHREIHGAHPTTTGTSKNMIVLARLREKLNALVAQHPELFSKKN